MSKRSAAFSARTRPNRVRTNDLANPMSRDRRSRDRTSSAENEVGDRTTTQAETRYGCFLPDLTGLATTPSARLPRRIWAKRFRRARSEQMQSLVHLIMQHTHHANAVRALVKVDEMANAPGFSETLPHKSERAATEPTGRCGRRSVIDRFQVPVSLLRIPAIFGELPDFIEILLGDIGKDYPARDRCRSRACAMISSIV